jgi:RHS repeat-associated protein
LGSVTAITDINTAVVQAYEYDSFGAAQQSANFRNSYTYTGREWDKETGLYYYRARFYDPMDGRFISKDPIGFKGGDMMLYGYVQNNPINLVDPKGLSSSLPPLISCFKTIWDAYKECGSEYDEAVAEAYKKLDWCEKAQLYCNVGNSLPSVADIDPKPSDNQCSVLGRNVPIDQLRMSCLSSPEVLNLFKQSYTCAKAAVDVVKCAVKQ